jgi:hypothetical protein
VLRHPGAGRGARAAGGGGGGGGLGAWLVAGSRGRSAVAAPAGIWAPHGDAARGLCTETRRAAALGPSRTCKGAPSFVRVARHTRRAAARPRRRRCACAAALCCRRLEHRLQ